MPIRKSRVRIVLELTKGEARALYNLASNSSDSNEDAKAVLVYSSMVNAGYRAINKLYRAMHGKVKYIK